MTSGGWQRALRFAFISTIRQPARTALGVLGVAAVGALLFDMLLLSRGLVLSFGGLLERGGFDVRVLATEAPPFAGPAIADASGVASAIGALPEVESVLAIRMIEAELVRDDRRPGQPADPPDNGAAAIDFIGAAGGSRAMWTVLQGTDVTSPAERPSVVINRTVARAEGVSVGSVLPLRGRCGAGTSAAPPVSFIVAGIAEFPFDSSSARTAGGSIGDIPALCGTPARDEADMLLVRSRSADGADAAAAAVRRALPALHVVTNADLVERFSRVEFSYFRQISIVLATVTLFFGFLLIAVLLTVSVNQRLGEIAVLRAVGLSRPRILAGVLFESALLVAAGGVLAVPLGLALSVWLEGILRAMPGVPADLRFFVFEPRALALHAGLLAAAAVAAAVYPMRIVAALPIAETLRREVVS
jgi:putative ABC transport system permease protein